MKLTVGTSVRLRSSERKDWRVAADSGGPTLIVERTITAQRAAIDNHHERAGRVVQRVIPRTKMVAP